jgi:hypothetical protein
MICTTFLINGNIMSDEFDYSVSAVDDPDNDDIRVNDWVDSLVINARVGGKKCKTRKYSSKRLGRKSIKRTNRKKMKY